MYTLVNEIVWSPGRATLITSRTSTLSSAAGTGAGRSIDCSTLTITAGLAPSSRSTSIAPTRSPRRTSGATNVSARFLTNPTTTPCSNSFIACSVLPGYSKPMAFHRVQFWYWGSSARQRSKSAIARSKNARSTQAMPRHRNAVRCARRPRWRDRAARGSGPSPRATPLLRVRQRRPRHRKRRIQLQCALGCRLRQRSVFAIVDAPASSDGIHRGQTFPAAREARVHLRDLLEQSDALRQFPACDEQLARLEVQLVRLEILGVRTDRHDGRGVLRRRPVGRGAH